MTAFHYVNLVLMPVVAWVWGWIGTERTRVARNYIRTIILILWVYLILGLLWR